MNPIIPIDSAKLILDKLAVLQEQILKTHENDYLLLYIFPIIFSLGTPVVIFLLTKEKEKGFFKRNRQKEIMIQTGKLFGKFREKAASYTLAFDVHNQSYIYYKHYEIISEYYEKLNSTDIPSDEEEKKRWSDQQEKYSLLCKKEGAESKDAFTKLMELKYQLQSLLYEINFYYDDEVLNNDMDEFFSIMFYSLKAGDGYMSSMERDGHLRDHIQQNVAPLRDKLIILTLKMSDRIRELSRKE
jgi:hypothetical protein